MMPAGVVEPQGVEYLTKPFTDDQLIASVAEAYNLARMQRFRHEEMRSLKESLLEFKTRTDAAVSQLIARARHIRYLERARPIETLGGSR